MRLKNRKKSAAAIKSMKVGTDELKDLIKGAVKEAMGEEDDTGDDGGDAAAALDGITAEDMADIIEQQAIADILLQGWNIFFVQQLV